jgi:hypothetical protein
MDDYRCSQFQVETLFQENTVPSRTVEGLLIQTNGLAVLLKI